MNKTIARAAASIGLALMLGACSQPGPTSAASTQGAVQALAAVNLALNAPTFASSYEDGNPDGYYAAKYANDGNLGTRWASAFKLNDQWLAVDLGAVKAIGSVQVTWEDAYASKYRIDVSDDNVTWRTVQTVTKTSFVDNVPDTTALPSNTSARYVRVWGLTRFRDIYGYSVKELSVLAPDGGAPTPIPPPPTPTPPTPPETGGGVLPNYVPLYNGGTPAVENIQYTEPDGTLVTYAGFRPTERHSREGGEEWTSPIDLGPGKHLTFPALYFQNRTYGMIIRDEVPAGRQKITAYLKPNNGTFINNGFSAYRRIDPNVIEYGWSDNTGFENKKEGNLRCHPAEKLEDLCVAPPIDHYWRYAEEGRPNSLLKVGDKIEMTPAQFLDHIPGTGKALIDGGAIRYYSTEQLYVVGKGFVPWYGVAPKLDSHPLPDDALLGGQASVSYNYSEEPHRVFQQTVNNIGIANMQRFVEGRRLFHTSFLDGKHSENPDVNPVFTQHAGQLGERFNEVRCQSCHTLNGRSAAASIGTPLHDFAVMVAAASTTSSITPDPTYGLNIQQQARSGPDYSVSVKSYQTTMRKLPDGEQIELQQPVYDFRGPVPAQFSVRQAPQVIGMGLLEAVDETTILALADPADTNGDGVRGVPNWVVNPETGERHLGRFGWKASKATVRQQSGSAFIQDMGITTPVFRSASCQRGTPECKTNAATPEVSDAEMSRLTAYIELLGVPAQRKYTSGYTDGIVTPPEHQITANTTATIEQGARLFAQASCTSCHVAELKTSPYSPFAELRSQVIHPYTDLLLHDMGPELADTMTEGQGTPNRWRTQPLWGLGSLKYVQNGTGQANAQSVRYLHDGRARTLKEAIGWHGGEAASSRARFENMSRADREALLTFLDSL